MTLDQPRVIPGTFRRLLTPRAVWVTNYGTAPRHGLQIAWRQQHLPSVADTRTYWFGLVIMARWYDDTLATESKWVWDAHLVPVPLDVVRPERTKAARPSRS